MLKKEKEKEFQHWWAGGILAQPGAVRAWVRGCRPSCGPVRVTARAREGTTLSPRAHTPERVEGGENGISG